MGEYAHDQMRREIKSKHGFDIGEYDDEPVKKIIKPVYKRVKCPHCDKHPKEAGLAQHIKDVHNIDAARREELRAAIEAQKGEV